MSDWITGIMEQMGAAGVALLMLLENVFPPVPSEVIMPFAGFAAARGELSLVTVILAGGAASLAGTTLWYWLGRHFGFERLARFADRKGRWIGISADSVEDAHAWFARHGRWAVLLGRLLPGIRTVISLPAGACGMPLLPFLGWSAVGTLLWTAALAGAGYLLGDQWRTVESYVGYAGWGLLGALTVWAAWKLRKKAQTHAG